MAKNTRDCYGFGLSGPSPALPPLPIISQRDPVAGDINFEQGTVWINEVSNQSWMLTSVAAGAATYSLMSPGASDVDTLTGDGGGAISPLAGNITLAGGTNITTAGLANTITYNLDPAITLATSVTAPLYTSAALMAITSTGAMTITSGGQIDVNAAAGTDITFQMGDAIGANIVEFEDSASAVVGTIDSDGVATFTGLEGIIGAVAPAAGTFTTVEATTYGGVGALDTIVTTTLGEDLILRLGDAAGVNFLRVQSSTPADIFTIDSTGTLAAMLGLTVTGAFTQTAGIVLIGDDAAANAVSIGTGAAAKVVTIGSVNGASSLDLLAGTGNFSLEGNVATTYAISNVGVNTGQVDIAGGTGARTINIGGGGTGAKTLNICTAASVDIISVGSATAGAITVDTGAGISLDSVTASNFTVTGAADLTINSTAGGVDSASGEAAVDAISLDASDAAGGVTIAAGTGGLNFGNQADCTTIGLGDFAPTANRGITIGGGTVITAATTDTIDIGPDGATTNANSIKTVCINSGGVTLGEVLTHIGAGAITSGTHTVNIQSGNAAAGTVATNISTGTGTKIVNVGNADAATTVNIDAVTVINDNINAAFSACTGTSTGTVTLGNIATSTAMALQSSTTIDIDAAGAMTMNSTAGTINIGNDDVDQNMGFGTDGERVVTVGSTNGAAGLVLQAGTGEITMTGTVKQIDAELMGTTGVYIPTINMSPVMTTAADTGGVCTGANTNVNLMSLQNQAIMEQYIIGTQTIIAPRMTANGLLISLDLTVAEGAEYNFGAALDSSFGFTVGTDGAFFFELDLYINDMDGADPYIFGFRKTEANNAVFANYTDYYAVGMNAATSVANVVIFDELNATGQTITDTTDAWGGDGTTNTLRVDVSAAGVCTTYINGVIASAAPAFTFDADRVTPFIRLTHSASATQVAITGMRIGLQA